MNYLVETENILMNRSKAKQSTIETVLFIHAHERDKAIFFSSISKFFNEKGIKTYHLVFSSIEEKIYEKLDAKNIIFLPITLKEYSHILTKDCTIKYNIESASKFDLKRYELNHYKINKKELFKNIKRYINFLEHLNNTYNFDLVITWNDCFSFDNIAHQFAIKNNIKNVIFEQGIFRPHTITIDFKGVNYKNSVPREKSFYENGNYDFSRFKKYVSKIENKNEIYSITFPKFKKYYWKEWIKDKLYTNITKKQLNMIPIKENYIHKIKRKFYRDKINKKWDNIILPKLYILVPFQVYDDSQVINFSPHVRDMFSLVELMDTTIKKMNKKFKDEYYVIFKEHPVDVGRINYEKLYNKFKNNKHFIFLKKYNNEKLINNCALVITINSSMGIEALIKHKRVITLGQTYYNIEGIVEHCSKIRNLHITIEKVLKSEVNNSLIDSFLYYLRFNYQIEGNWRKGIFNSNQLINRLNLTMIT